MNESEEEISPIFAVMLVIVLLTIAACMLYNLIMKL